MKIASDIKATAAAAVVTVVACLSAVGTAPASAELAVDPSAAAPPGSAGIDALIRKGKAAPGAKRAECKDGSYSFAAHRKAKACAHHGGVVRWL